MVGPTQRLTDAQFRQTIGGPRALADDEAAPFDMWSYFDAIPPADFAGRDCSAGSVRHVWRMTTTPFEHVLVDSDLPNVFMVLVLDRTRRIVHGHRLLDLDGEYGVDRSSPDTPRR